MAKIILSAYILTTTLALIALKHGTSAGMPISIINNKLQYNLNIYNVSGVFLYFLSFITYTYLISKFDLGYIIPIAAAFVYIVIFAASALIFHEVFTATKIVGIALILGGLVFLNINK